MPPVAYAQLDVIIDQATKLRDAGLIAMLVVVIIVLCWVIVRLYRNFTEPLEKIAKEATIAIVASTKATEAHTRALEANEHASLANKEALTAIKTLLETISHKMLNQ
jgi:hypothetical protein